VVWLQKPTTFSLAGSAEIVLRMSRVRICDFRAVWTMSVTVCGIRNTPAWKKTDLLFVRVVPVDLLVPRESRRGYLRWKHAAGVTYKNAKYGPEKTNAPIDSILDAFRPSARTITFVCCCSCPHTKKHPGLS